LENYFKSISTKYDSLRGSEILSPLCKALKGFTREDSKVLDVACGTGLFLVPVATKFDFEFYGSDISLSMLKTAYTKAKSKDLKVNFLMSDVHNLPFPNKYFDVLISTNAIHHFDLVKSLNECARVLKDSGSYIVFSRFREQNDRSFWGKNFPKFASKEDRLYYRKEFEDVAGKIEELELESINEYSFERKSTRDEILEFAANKKYSTFDLYDDEEFNESLNSFKNWLNSKKDIKYTAEIGEVIFRRAR
jgi:ubiquinone/menaquinone biosynthesis C-methylase UbiE